MEETIAAISTAYGEGGIGIIRVSGSESLLLLDDVFQPGRWTGEIRDAAKTDPEKADHKMRYGQIVDRKNENRIDECMAVFFRSPASYTTEDMAEIYCHGSVVAQKNTLSLILRSGARLAEPGEFTKRAFLNGRIDLSQAEAVIDMIKAKTDSSYDMAMYQLDGSLSREIGKLRNGLLDILVEITVNIDYPEEDIEEMTLERAAHQISQISDQITGIIETSSTGRMIREGIKVAIAGRPNVGKSSLMNRLLGEDRAIVTEIPGTTRDTIEEGASIRGLPVIIVDTAGIHDTEDKVEALGIERSRRAFDKADLIILLLDGSHKLTEEDRMLLQELAGKSNKQCMIAINKQDLPQQIEEDTVTGILPEVSMIRTSMTDGTGLDRIEDKIEEMIYDGRLYQKDSLIVSNVRHIDLLRQANEDLLRAKAMADRHEPLDIIEVDVRSAFDSLGEIIGQTVSDEVLNEVFSRFCLGK